MSYSERQSRESGMEEEGLVGQLEALGLTRNQSLAYLTLLQDDGGQGLTGYEVGSRSGVPRSAVYKVLRQLEEAGAAFPVGQEPQRFVAAAPERWLERVKRGTLARIDELGGALRLLPRRSRPEPVWIVSRYDEVLERSGDMIRGAKASVYVSMWGREIERLRPAFEAVADGPLHRVLFCPEALERPPRGFRAWVDDAPDPGKAAWSHKVLVVVDHREALIGGSEPDADNHAVWTTNPSLVDVAANHVILDVTLMARRTGRSAEEDVAPMMRPNL